MLDNARRKAASKAVEAAQKQLSTNCKAAREGWRKAVAQAQTGAVRFGLWAAT